MTKPFTEWTVLPHGKLSRIDDNVLSVVGSLDMPIGDFPRRMTIVRLASGKLIIFSAIALDEEEMEAVETFGTPSYLIVPSDIHRMDAKIWKTRYPELVVIAPAGSRDKVEKIVHVDQTTARFDDPDVDLVIVPGTNDSELALVVRSATGTTLVVNDVIWNVDDRPGLGGKLFKLLGLTKHEPQIPTVVRLRTIRDKAALRAQLEAWAKLELKRIIVSHGGIVTKDPAGTLHDLAAKLAA
jgi:hypothetical protein